MDRTHKNGPLSWTWMTWQILPCPSLPYLLSFRSLTGLLKTRDLKIPYLCTRPICWVLPNHTFWLSGWQTVSPWAPFLTFWSPPDWHSEHEVLPHLLWLKPELSASEFHLEVVQCFSVLLLVAVINIINILTGPPCLCDNKFLYIWILEIPKV